MSDAMTEEELSSTIDKYLKNSLQVRTNDLDEDMADAIDFYYGKEFGNEVEGRSSVVTRDVLESVEWALPSIIRVFASGDRFVEFDPVGPEDVAASEQETDYINHLIIKKNNGWKMFFDWFKGAMLYKNAYIKSWVEEKKTIEVTQHSGMNADQLIAMRAQEGAEIEDLNETFDEYTGETLYDFSLRITSKKKEIKSECVPPEEMRMFEGWNKLSLDGCPFVAHERNMSISDLVAMGFDEEEVRDSAMNSGSEYADNETERARNVYSDDVNEDGEDDSQEVVNVEECYVLVDFDGDGISELRKIFKIGKKIFENSELDEQPFSTISPMPMPHQHIGLSYGELSMDIQKIRSTLIRQMLDNLYLTNNPEKEIVEDMVNMEDFMVSVPGGLKRVSAPGMVRELTVPFTAGQSMPMLTILDQMKETRTGVSRGSMGLDADVLAKTTRGAFFGAMENASQRIEMISRVFAETGVKELFRKVHKLALTHLDKTEVIKIRGTYVPVNPSQWQDRTDMTIVVGLGAGNRDQQLSHLSTVVDKQEQHLLQGSPMVELRHLYHTYDKMLNLIGFKDTSNFFLDPQSPEFMQKMQRQAQQPKEPSDTDKALQVQQQIEELKAKVNAMNAQTKAQVDIAKFKEELQFKYDKMMEEMTTKMTELELEYLVDVPGSKV